MPEASDTENYPVKVVVVHVERNEALEPITSGGYRASIKVPAPAAGKGVPRFLAGHRPACSFVGSAMGGSYPYLPPRFSWSLSPLPPPPTSSAWPSPSSPRPPPPKTSPDFKLDDPEAHPELDADRLPLRSLGASTDEPVLQVSVIMPAALEAEPVPPEWLSRSLLRLGWHSLEGLELLLYLDVRDVELSLAAAWVAAGTGTRPWAKLDDALPAAAAAAAVGSDRKLGADTGPGKPDLVVLRTDKLSVLLPLS